MKSILLISFISLLFKSPSAEFNGVLKYESDYDLAGSVGKVLTTIYETKSSFGTPVTKDQNVLLFDFSKQQETHLQTLTSRALVGPYTESLLLQNKHGEEMLNAIKVDVQNMGSEKIGEYNCTHFVVTKLNTKQPTSKMNPSKNDVWVTKDLGSCHLWYVGAYLYYPEGSFTQKKLADAGIDGVVVKWQTGSGSLQISGMLMSYEKKNLSSSTFSPPSNFTTVQANMSATPQ
jgi:Domain of unknown function (DUF4412)